MPRRMKPLPDATPDYDDDPSDATLDGDDPPQDKDPISETLTRSLAREAARYVAAHLDFQGWTSAKDPAGHNLAIRLAKVGGIHREIEAMLARIRPRR